MKPWLSALVLLSTPLWGAAKAPRWQIHLDQSQGLESFDRDYRSVWMGQQGVLFLTPELLLVYQVNRTREPANLRPRGSNGGAGNFVLDIRVLSVQDGHLIKTLDLPTNGALSRVMATQNGGFLVRAGSMLSLYSPHFDLVASRELPVVKAAPVEDWQLRVSPSGAEIVLLHEQVFSSPELLADNSVIHDGEAKVDFEILNSADLQSKNTFTLSHALPFWAPLEDRLISSNPAHSYSDGQVGVLDFSGKWWPIRAEVELERSPCRYRINAIDQQRIVLYGCETFTVLTTSGKRVFSRNDARYVFTAAAGYGAYLAVECDHYRDGQTDAGGGRAFGTRPDRIEVYDLESRTRVLSLPVHSESAYYAISPKGDLALVDGSILQVVPAETGLGR